MIPRTKRLSRAAFQTAGVARRISSTHFSISLHTPSSSRGCAAIVSKKTAKLSSDRHLLKRRMLSVARPWCTPERSFALYARSGSPLLPFSGVREELEDLLTRLFGRIA